MKRILSLVLAMVMVLGSFSAVFAAEVNFAEEAVETLMDLGVLKEGKLDQNLKRQDAIVLLSRLMGEEDAKAFPSDNLAFADVKDSFYKGYISWAVAEKLTEGKSATRFGFNDPLTAQQFAMFLLRALGYGDVAYDKALEKATELKLLVNVEAGAAGITRGTMAVMTLNALGTPVKGSEKTLAEELGHKLPEVVPATLEVKEIKVAGAKSFLVTFNKAVEDTSKFGFSVKRGGTDVKVAATWNEAKSEATLTSDSNLPASDYVVVVSDKRETEAKEMVKYELKVEKEKIEEVVFSSEMINRINDLEGVVTYRVKNQYGEDITNSGLARNITWIASTSKPVTPDYTNGILTITHGEVGTPGNQLINLKNVIVTGTDYTTGFSVTKNLEVSTFIGSIGEIKINGLVDKDGKAVELVADSTKAYYLDVEVYDNAGNRITSHKLLNAAADPSKGMHQPMITVYTSNPNINVVIEEKDGKAQFRVNVIVAGGTQDYDMPVVFTAISNYTGKTATFNTTLLKSKKLEKFTLQYPAKEVAAGETVEIPYEAYDQNGNKITRFEDINGKVIINASNATVVTPAKSDSKGNYKLLVTFGGEGASFITATVPTTASFHQITLNVREGAKPVNLGNISVSDAFEVNATMNFAFGGSSITKLVAKDKFDRDLSLYYNDNYAGKNYHVEATSSNTAAFTTSGQANLKNKLTVTATGAGVSTITFKLMEAGNPNAIATKSITLVAVERKDIVGLKANLVSDGYAVDKLPLALQGKDIESEYHGVVTYKGLLSNGGTVRLAAGTLAKATVNHPKLAMSGNNYVVASLGNENTIKATVTGYIYGTNGMIAGSVEINPTNAVPVNENISVSYTYDAIKAGKVNSALDEVTLALAEINTKNIFAYNPTTGDEGGDAPFYFVVSNQYGDGGLVERVFVQKQSGTGTMSVDLQGNVTATGTGTFIVTAITNNGLTKTVQVVIQ